MNDISKEQVWALRSAAANGSLTDSLATVILCNNLLAAWKERDEAQRNLENIKAARAKDKCDGCAIIKIITEMRSILGTPLGVDVRDHMREMRANDRACNSVTTVAAERVLAAVRDAAGAPFGKSIVDFVAVMRDRLGRYEDEQEQVRSILGATEVETLDDAADRVAKEAEGLYRFKCRIREALGVEKGVDMAEEVRKLKAAPKVGVNVRTLITERIRDCLYDLCEDAGIDWPGETLGGTEPVRHAIVAAIKNGEGSKHNDTAMRQNLAEKTAALEAAERKARELFERNAEAVSRAESAEKRIKELESNQEANTRRLLTSVWCEALNKQETECWRRSSTETMFVSIVEGVKYQTKRIDELESTIREHEKDLKVIEELQDEQTKLVSTLMRMAEGRKPVVTLTSKFKSPQIFVDPRTLPNCLGLLLDRWRDHLWQVSDSTA